MTSETPIRDIIIGAILFSAVIAGSLGLFSLVAANKPGFYGTNDMEGFNASFNKMIEIDAQVQELKGAVTGNNTAESTILEKLGVIGTIYNIIWNGIKTVFTSFDFVLTLIPAAMAYIAVPGWAILAVSSILAVMILFTIISLVFNKDT
jgi:hypothetical protein